MFLLILFHLLLDNFFFLCLVQMVSSNQKSNFSFFPRTDFGASDRGPRFKNDIEMCDRRRLDSTEALELFGDTSIMSYIEDRGEIRLLRFEM